MSELQIGLLAIGIVVVAAVYVYGYWQQRQYRRKYGDKFGGQRDDALYQSARPGLVADVLIEEDVVELEQHEAKRADTDDEIVNLLNASSDYVVAITPNTPLSSAVLSPLWAVRFDFGKRINACGQNTLTGRWERLIPDSHPAYSAFKIGLQLADRSGPVSEVRLMEFHDVLRDVAEQARAEVVLPPVADALKQAKLLDEFCAEVDQMIGLNIFPGGDRLLFGSEIAQVAERHGMQLQADGSFHFLDARGHTQFSLSTFDSTPFQHHTLTQMRVQGLTLLLDVPRVESPSLRFDEMAELARAMAQEMRAALVDDHRVSLGDVAIAQIRERVAAVESRMLEGKIVPGSAQALRLFA
jgi:FtsZ-interacting cell division protein ZipA